MTNDSGRIAREYVRSTDYRTGPSFSESRLAAACTEMMEDFYSDGIHFSFITHSNELHDFATYVESRFANIEECLYYSTDKCAPFASQLCIDAPRASETTKPVDDVYYIAKTRLQDEMLVLPEPRDLNDVLRMRNAKEMARFRQVLTQWCASLHEGSAKAEQRMRRDVAKANRELTRLSKWKRWKESPLNFVVSAVGGHIPILSNVLTVITMVGGMYEYRVERNHNWVMVGQR